MNWTTVPCPCVRHGGLFFAQVSRNAGIQRDRIGGRWNHRFWYRRFEVSLCARAVARNQHGSCARFEPQHHPGRRSHTGEIDRARGREPGKAHSWSWPLSDQRLHVCLHARLLAAGTRQEPKRPSILPRQLAMQRGHEDRNDFFKRALGRPPFAAGQTRKNLVDANCDRSSLKMGRVTSRFS